MIRGNRIIWIATASAHFDSARVIDAKGKYLIPGLWDMHTHVFSNVSNPGTDLSRWAFPLYVANGITGVRDMWTDPDDIPVARRWNDERARGELLAPRVEWSSEVVDGVPPHIPQSTGVATAEEARRVVRELKAGGAGFIKVYWRLQPDVFFAIADEAKEQGIPFAGHVPWAVSAFEASDAGMLSIEHLTGVSDACHTYSKELDREVFDETLCAALCARYAKNGTWQVPTLVLHESRELRESRRLLSSPALAYVPDTEKKTWNLDWDPKAPVSEQRRAQFTHLLGILGDMHRAGVPIMAGTDVGNPLIVPGFSLHDELTLMVGAGLSPLEALQTATRNVGIYLGRSDIGTVAKGALADLVILDADPTADIRNTRQIEAVVLGGRLLSRSQLDALLAKVKAQRGDSD